MAAWLVPWGRALEPRSAEYGPPTPWTQRLLPYSFSRALATAGPVLEPYYKVLEIENILYC